MLDIGAGLRHYKNPEVQKEMVYSARGREVAVKYGERGFGKRPDVLNYPKDVLEFAKNGATSFHVSEEHWSNPLMLSADMKKEDIDELRSGWDLVIDIDSKNIKLSKIIAWLVIRSLREHGIRGISIKFSGNKGFHIGVPFKSFPEFVHGTETRLLFPEGPRRIAAYLIRYIAERHITAENDAGLMFGGKIMASIKDVEELSGKSIDDLSTTICAKCKAPGKKGVHEKAYEFLCSRCGSTAVSEKQIMKCEKCSAIMGLCGEKKQICQCGSHEFVQRLNTNALIEIDTLLISSRHMYRMPYSLHEKSGLCSLPFPPDDILKFKREMAEPKAAGISENIFLDESMADANEAADLIVSAFDETVKEDEIIKKFAPEAGNAGKDYEALTQAIPSDFFPPCMKNILNGLKDGRKRSMFILINFLTSTGYSLDEIEKILLDWNRKNLEPLQEVLIRGHIRYSRTQKRKALPPNCQQKAKGDESYYKALLVCTPDSFCQKIKNPANYSILRAKIAQKDDMPKREKLTDEQKEMRKKFREEMKAKTASEKKDNDQGTNPATR